MKYLFKGMQSNSRFELLIMLTKIDSEQMIDALRDFLVRGMDKKSAAILNGVKQSNFSAALKALNEKAAIVEQIKELDGIS
ncbi:PapB/FocB family fimbrial expression transcriptional regulator [Pseudoalteromonas obscura]|uniref:PapB/FocB family fimbrial expression transcriptional regulator n=1 Tax=Pseudoalteromonas obscura TaxID=3048491 RepID=A0ABT7ESC1_9GAMM|nr:PapB/FocB family fimbrial expression transcriptional regulator [Pseudoalteromonas sp. P94(2023)]MDK2597914.1 PapB/FocB family fimbrial expression transcriptional regulator [Pseudoalteromonas sp. P94(2023)]